MMKYLNGLELAGYIKERQAHQVRSLRQSKNIVPKLAIVICSDNQVIKTYLTYKQKYGHDILVETEVYKVSQKDAYNLIVELNHQPKINGIIIQLPLKDVAQTDELLNLVDSKKDVDGLGSNSNWDCPTATAILWLLAGYNIELQAKNIVIIGKGRLVGAPLKKMLVDSEITPKIIDSKTKNPQQIIQNAQIIITGIGKPGIITADMIPKNCVVVDAGTTSDSGKLKGDLADNVYKRDDLVLTPKIGGIGPLTIAALFDNVIRAATPKDC